MLDENSTPQEIMEALPVGKVIELSGRNIQFVVFLLRAKKATNHLHRALADQKDRIKSIELQFPDDDMDERRKRIKDLMTDIIDEEWAENPFEAMICANMAGGVSHPMSAQLVSQTQGQIWVMIWSLILEEFVKEHGYPKAIFDKLQLELIEKPTPRGVLVKGYNFTADDLGYGDVVDSQDDGGFSGEIPDHIPEGFFDGLDLGGE